MSDVHKVLIRAIPKTLYIVVVGDYYKIYKNKKSAENWYNRYLETHNPTILEYEQVR